MGFIEDYVSYHDRRCDAPDIFATVESLFLAGAAMGRHFVNPLNIEARHNFYVFLVSPTSTRKSTSMGISTEFIRSAGIDELPMETTPEAMISALEEKPQSVYMKDEFGDELSKIAKKNSYMGGFTDVMSHLWKTYDKYTRKTQTQGDIEVIEPYLSVFVATTDDRFDAYARNDTVMSGFLPRFLIVFLDPSGSDVKAYKPLYYIDESADRRETEGLKMRIDDFLRGLHGLNNDYVMKYQDIDYFNEKLRGIQESAKGASPVIAALYNKMGEYLTKIADVLKVSDLDLATIASSQVIRVENRYIDRALELIDRITDRYPEQFENRVEYKNFNLAIRRIQEYIRLNQSAYDSLPLSKPEIVSASAVDVDTFDEAMRTLIEGGKVMQLFAKEMIDPNTREHVNRGKEVFILADHYSEFAMMIDCDIVGSSLRVYQLRNGTVISVFPENSRLNDFI